MTLFLHFFFIYNAFFFLENISYVFASKKGKSPPLRFILFRAGHRRDCTFIQKFMCKTCKLRTPESQFSTAPERLHTCSDVTWDQLTGDQLPEDITMRKAKPIRDQAQGVAPRRKLRKKEKMQNYPSA